MVTSQRKSIKPDCFKGFIILTVCMEACWSIIWTFTKTHLTDRQDSSPIQQPPSLQIHFKRALRLALVTQQYLMTLTSRSLQVKQEMTITESIQDIQGLRGHKTAAAQEIVFIRQQQRSPLLFRA